MIRPNVHIHADPNAVWKSCAACIEQRAERAEAENVQLKERILVVIEVMEKKDLKNMARVIRESVLGDKPYPCPHETENVRLRAERKTLAAALQDAGIYRHAIQMHDGYFQECAEPLCMEWRALTRAALSSFPKPATELKEHCHCSTPAPYGGAECWRHIHVVNPNDPDCRAKEAEPAFPRQETELPWRSGWYRYRCPIHGNIHLHWGIQPSPDQHPETARCNVGVDDWSNGCGATARIVGWVANSRDDYANAPEPAFPERTEPEKESYGPQGIRLYPSETDIVSGD